MKSLIVKNVTKNSIIADKCGVAERFFERLAGLIFYPGLGEGQGLLFPRCNSIHMWFMRFAIDVVFVRHETDAKGRRVSRVSSVRTKLRPWRLLPVFDFWAHDAIELQAGSVQALGIEPGDELCTS